MLHEDLGQTEWPRTLVANEQMIRVIFNLGLRIGLFALSLILMRASGKTFLATSFAFFGDMNFGDFLRIVLWMFVYIVIAIVSLFLAFNLEWLKRRSLVLVAATGMVAALSHRASVDCSGPINRLDTFNFLGCVGGYELTSIAVGLSLLLLLLATRVGWEEQA